MCFSLNFSGRDDIGSTWTTVVNVHELRLLPAKSSHALRELLNLSTKLSKSLFILLVSEQCLQFRNLKYSGSFFGREVLKRPGGSASETSFWILGVRSLVWLPLRILCRRLLLWFEVSCDYFLGLMQHRVEECRGIWNILAPPSKNRFSYLFSHVSLGDEIILGRGVFDRIPFECIMSACFSPNRCLGWSMGCTPSGEGTSIVRFLLSYKMLISSSSCACVVHVFL